MIKKDEKTKSFRLTGEAAQLLERLARQWGVSQTAVLEMLIREKAKAEGISATE